MEYALLGALLIGILLFTIGWLVVIVQGFQRHPLVGLFTLIPGLNLVAIPSLWHKVSGWFITSVIGVLIMAGAWLGGADSRLPKQMNSWGLSASTPVQSTSPAIPAVRQQPPAQAASEAKPLALPAGVTNNTVPVQAGEETTLTTSIQQKPVVENSRPTKALPIKPLYRIVFKTLPLDKLSEQTGEYIRITQTNGQMMEGKLLKTSDKDIVLESSERGTQGKPSSRTIKLTDLKDAALMVNEQEKD